MPHFRINGSTSVGLAGASLPGRPAPHSTVRSGARPICVPLLSGAQREEIKVLAARTCSVIIPDRSGSMYGSWGDPSDVCGAAAESLLDLQRRSGGGRAAVVPWGTTAPAALVTGPLDVVKGRKELSRALREHSSLGGNDMAAALDRTREVITPVTPDDTVIGFLLTDGIESVTQRVHDAVAALPPQSVHMLLVDRGNGCSPDLQAQWRSVAFGSFTVLNHLDVTEMANQLVAIYADTLGLMATAAPSSS